MFICTNDGVVIVPLPLNCFVTRAAHKDYRLSVAEVQGTETEIGVEDRDDVGVNNLPKLVFPTVTVAIKQDRLQLSGIATRNIQDHVTIYAPEQEGSHGWLVQLIGWLDLIGHSQR